MAIGTKDGRRSGPKISITFDQELFDAINQNAQDNGANFGETVRALCRINLDKEPLASLEKQVSRLSREIDRLRAALSMTREGVDADEAKRLQNCES